MIPLTTLYDNYIERPKLTEQDTQFEYIVPPLTIVGRNNICMPHQTDTFTFEFSHDLCKNAYISL